VAEFINPNWHIILIHYPLGLFIVGVLIELFSFLWRRSGFRAAGRWMILIGALSMIPTVTTGLYALNDVILMHTEAGSEYLSWHDRALASPLTQDQWWMLQWHLWLQIAATGAAVIAVVSWLGGSDNWRHRFYYPTLLLLLISVGLMVAGSWYSGEAIYRHGVGTETSETTHTDDHTGPEFFAPPVELHVTLVGFAMALVMASLGLSLRAAAVARAAERTIEAPPAHPDDQVDSLMRSIKPDVIVADMAHTVPAARFWLVSALLLLLAAGAGVWYLASDAGTWKADQLWKMIAEDTPRRLAHVVLGVSLVVLTLVLEGVARWAPRKRGLLLLVALLLVIVTAAQIWMGAFLLYDSPQGPITGLLGS
jgi:uncharacterized membrane protein